MNQPLHVRIGCLLLVLFMVVMFIWHLAVLGDEVRRPPEASPGAIGTSQHVPAAGHRPYAAHTPILFSDLFKEPAGH